MWASHWLAICRGIRESLETMIGRNGVWSAEKYIEKSMTRRCKALFRDCYCRDVMDIMSAVSWWCRTPQSQWGCRIKIFNLWRTILNAFTIVNSFISIMVLIKLIKLLSIITVWNLEHCLIKVIASEKKSVFANTYSYSPPYIRDTNRIRHLVYSFQP